MKKRVRSYVAFGVVACFQTIVLSACGGGGLSEDGSGAAVLAGQQPSSSGPSANVSLYSSDQARAGVAINALTAGSNRNMVSSSKDCTVCVFNATSGDASASNIAQAKLAIDAGKTVVIDSDGSDKGQLAVASLVAEITGIGIRASAVKITGSGDTAQVTPIFTAPNGSTEPVEKIASSNSANNVLNTGEGAQQ